MGELQAAKLAVVRSHDLQSHRQAAAAETDPMIELLTSRDEQVAGFQVTGGKAMLGTVFIRRITMLQNPAGPQLSWAGLESVIGAFEAEARAAGATELRITGLAVDNPGFARMPRTWAQYGYTYTQFGGSTFEIVKPL